MKLGVLDLHPAPCGEEMSMSGVVLGRDGWVGIYL